MIPPSSSGKTSAASVVARLRNIARERGLSVEAARDHFAREAFLRRLVASPFAGDFVLKGSVLLLAWFREFHRPTMDADFLVRKPMSSDDLRAALTTIITILVRSAPRSPIVAEKCRCNGMSGSTHFLAMLVSNNCGPRFSKKSARRILAPWSRSLPRSASCWRNRCDMSNLNTSSSMPGDLVSVGNNRRPKCKK